MPSPKTNFHRSPAASAPTSATPKDSKKSTIDETCQLLKQLELAGGENRKLAGDASPLVRNLIFAINRQRAAFDWLLDKQTQKPLRARLRRILWWSLAQLFCLNGLKAPIIGDIATSYTKANASTPEANFVNAVFRRLAAQAQEKTLDEMLLDAPLYVRLRLPQLLCDRWQNAWKDDPTRLETVAQALLQTPSSTFRVRRYPGCGEPPLPQPGLLLPMTGNMPWLPQNQHFYTAKDQETEATMLRELGKLSPAPYYVQDPSTVLAPTMLQAEPGERLADLCAAPGGKSVILAEALNGEGYLLCGDRSESRLKKLNANLLGFTNVDIQKLDAVVFTTSEPFDGILLDVPCSNTGVIRRLPDVRWNFTLDKLRELTALQSQILENSAKLLPPGGRLVYSTCSLEPEENLLQVKNFLDKHPEFTLETQCQLYPDNSHDGGFAARLRKSSN